MRKTLAFMTNDVKGNTSKFFFTITLLKDGYMRDVCPPEASGLFLFSLLQRFFSSESDSLVIFLINQPPAAVAQPVGSLHGPAFPTDPLLALLFPPSPLSAVTPRFAAASFLGF